MSVKLIFKIMAVTSTREEIVTDPTIEAVTAPTRTIESFNGTTANNIANLLSDVDLAIPSTEVSPKKTARNLAGKGSDKGKGGCNIL
jgi:hypothetical protein